MVSNLVVCELLEVWDHFRDKSVVLCPSTRDTRTWVSRDMLFVPLSVDYLFHLPTPILKTYFINIIMCD